MHSIIVTLVGITVVYLYLIGDLVFYIYPGYNTLSLITGIIFIFVGVYSGIREFNAKYRSSSHACCNEGRQSSFSFFELTIFIPIIIGLLMPAQPLSVETALTRGTALALESKAVSAFDIFTTNPESRNLIEWVRVLTANPEPDTYKGQKVNIEGFLIYPKDFPNEVYISQFIISCCAADARPISLSVNKNKLFDTYKEGDWIRLEGVFDVLENSYERRVLIQANKITRITTPKDPYEYQ